MTLSVKTPEYPPVAIYGAGRRSKSAVDELWRKGLLPVCFCDHNPDLWGRPHFGLPVLCIDNAKNLYPNLRIHISPAEPLRTEIYQELLVKHAIPKEAIINFEECRSYKSCRFLENAMMVTRGCTFFCCNSHATQNKPFYTEYKDGDIESLVISFVDKRDSVIRANKTPGVTTPCTGCRELREGTWEEGVKTLDFCPPAPCNMSCYYCEVGINATMTPAEYMTKEEIRLPDLLAALHERNLITDDLFVTLSSGEITVHPRRDELLKAVERYRTQILTSAAVYDQRIAHLASREGSWCCMSLDSGVSETYAKIKRRNLFAKVTENLFRYRSEGANILVKYILLPENIDRKNIEGFVALMGELRPKQITVARNLSVPDEQITPAFIEAGRNLIDGVRAQGLNAYALPYFRNEDMAILSRGI